MSRPIKFRAWCGTRMEYDYRDVTLWNGFLVAEGDTILEQFTGLKDANGHDIYEGDILDTIQLSGLTYPNRTVVEYHGMAFAFVGKTPRKEKWRSKYSFDTITNEAITKVDGMVVVGNIHENPGLLKP